MNEVQAFDDSKLFVRRVSQTNTSHVTSNMYTSDQTCTYAYNAYNPPPLQSTNTHHNSTPRISSAHPSISLKIEAGSTYGQ